MSAGLVVIIGLICIAFGTLYFNVPDVLKYGWRRKYPEELKLLSEESYKKFMRKGGVILIILGCVLIFVCIVLRLSHRM